VGVGTEAPIFGGADGLGRVFAEFGDLGCGDGVEADVRDSVPDGVDGGAGELAEDGGWVFFVGEGAVEVEVDGLYGDN